MSDARRPRRVAETVRKHIAQSLGQGMFDPRLHSLMITRVELGADLSVAHVYVRGVVSEAPGTSQQDIERAAARVAPLLRKGLAHKLGMRRVPEIRFHYDRQQDDIDRIDSILKEIDEERAQAHSVPPVAGPAAESSSESPAADPVAESAGEPATVDAGSKLPDEPER